MDHVVGLGGGLGASLYLFLPLLLPAASAIMARSARQRCVKARVDHQLILELWLSLGVLAEWIAALAITAAFG